MRKRLHGWLLGVGVLALAGLAGTLHADARDDLGRVKSDHDAARSHYDNAKSKLEQYLDESVKLRAMDKDQLNELITQICVLDEKRDDDEADRLAKELKDKVVDKVKREYEVHVCSMNSVTSRARPRQCAKHTIQNPADAIEA